MYVWLNYWIIIIICNIIFSLNSIAKLFSLLFVFFILCDSVQYRSSVSEDTLRPGAESISAPPSTKRSMILTRIKIFACFCTWFFETKTQNKVLFLFLYVHLVFHVCFHAPRSAPQSVCLLATPLTFDESKVFWSRVTQALRRRKFLFVLKRYDIANASIKPPLFSK